MSIRFRSLKKVSIEELSDGRLAGAGLAETGRCFSDGDDHIWICIDESGFAVTETTDDGENPFHLLDIISDRFGTDFVSEYSPQYWGYETQRDWDEAVDGAARAKIAQEEQVKGEILKLLRREPVDLDYHELGHAGREWARIAALVAVVDPALLEQGNEESLWKEVDTEFAREEQEVQLPF